MPSGKDRRNFGRSIAADYFALRKSYQGTRWIFSESRNSSNPASHCDIAWAGALASHAHTANKGSIGAAVLTFVLHRSKTEQN